MDILILSEEDVQRLLDPQALLHALAAGFTELSRGQIVAPARQEITAQHGSFLIMPAWQPQSHAAIKMVSLFHANQQSGLPTHQTLISLFDAQTGTPLAVMNGDPITALRTAGATALSVQLLARQDARVLAILGAGVQGQAHAQLLSYIGNFQEIRVASRQFAHARQLAASIARARPVASFEEAVRGADVVCLCSSSATPIISADWLSPGTHLTSVGFMPPGAELGHDVIERGKIFVETRQACEAAPVGCSELAGLALDLVTELGEILLSLRPGRQSAQEITVYKAMGHAIEDLVTANLIYQQAQQQGIGQRVKM
jgi:alanine dehydrogenase